MKIALYIISLLAIYAIVQRQDAADAEYTKNLETVVAQCLSDGTGRPITIGNKIFFCSIYDTGEKI